MESKIRWRLGRRAAIGIALVVALGGGAGVAVAADRPWFGDDPQPVANQAAAPEGAQRSPTPPAVADSEQRVPEPLSPPKPSQSTTKPKPPKPAAKCSPRPAPVPPKPRTGGVPSTRIPFNGRQVVSVCTAPALGETAAKVLTFNQAARVLDALGDLKVAERIMRCTREYRGTFQVVVQTATHTYVFNGEGHGCGYVTYGGTTYTGGKPVFSLIAQYLRS